MLHISALLSMCKFAREMNVESVKSMNSYDSLFLVLFSISIMFNTTNFSNNDYIIQLLTDRLSAYNDFEMHNEHPLYNPNNTHLPDAEDRLDLVSSNIVSIRAEIIQKYPNFTDASNENKWYYIRMYLLKDAIVEIRNTCDRIDWHTLQPQPKLDYKFLLGRISWLIQNKSLVRRNIRDAYGLDNRGVHELIRTMSNTITAILASTSDLHQEHAEVTEDDIRRLFL